METESGGDLFALDEEDIQFFSETLSLYKEVREDVTVSYPRIQGEIGGSPEIYEKINPDTGKGMVVIFTHSPARVTHVTQPIPQPEKRQVTGADRIAVTQDQCLQLQVEMEANSAQIIFIQ